MSQSAIKLPTQSGCRAFYTVWGSYKLVKVDLLKYILQHGLMRDKLQNIEEKICDHKAVGVYKTRNDR